MGNKQIVKARIMDSNTISEFTSAAKPLRIKKKDGKPKTAKTEVIETEKESQPHQKIQIILSVLGVLGIIGSLILSTIDALWFYITLVATTLILVVDLTLYFKNNTSNLTENEKSSMKLALKAMNPVDKRLISLIFIGILASSITLIVAEMCYEITIEVTMCVVAILELTIGTTIYDRLTDAKKNPTKYTNFHPKYHLAQGIIVMFLFFFAIPTLCGIDLFSYLNLELGSYSSLNITYNLIMTLVAMSGIMGILQMKNTFTEVGDYDKTSLIRFLAMILLPITALMIFPISSQTIEQGVILGAIGGFDYFNGILLSITQSPYTLFSMVVIVLGSLTIIVGKAQGKSGSGLMSVGALGMAGVPMIITVMAFIGQVPAPPEFYSLFGEGFAELIYAISYTTVISLALALVGVFYEVVPSIASGSIDD